MVKRSSETHSLYFSSAIRSRTGMPERNRMMSVVKIGESIATYSMPLMTFNEMMNIPHHKTISPENTVILLQNNSNPEPFSEALTEIVRVTTHSP